MIAPTLVACAHGTRSPAGRAAIDTIVADIRNHRPGLDVRAAFVDVQDPSVDDIVPHDRPSVVVPLLLSTGFHVRHDLAAAVAGRPSVVAAPLGPDPRLAELLARRIREAGIRDGDALVVAAAGSSDPAAAAAVEQTVAMMCGNRSGHTTVAFGSAARPSVLDAVAAERAAGHDRVVVGAYLLAPGHFHSVFLRAGADAVSAPLAPGRELAEIASDRYAAALRLHAGASR